MQGLWRACRCARGACEKISRLEFRLVGDFNVRVDIPFTLLPLTSIVSLLSSVNLFEHVNSKLTSRTPPLTSSSHPLQPSCLLMYHVLLLALLITTSSWLSSKSSSLFRPSSHLFSELWRCLGVIACLVRAFWIVCGRFI